MPNNTDALITLGVNIPRSIGIVKDDIKTMEKALRGTTKLKLDVGLSQDIGSINSQINTISKSIKPIDIKVNVGDFGANNMASNFANQGIKAGLDFSTNFNNNVKLKFDTGNLKTLEAEFKKYANDLAKLNGFDMKGVTVNTDGLGNFKSANINYYNDAMKETVSQTYELVKANPELANSMMEIALINTKVATDIEKATKAQNRFVESRDKLVNSLEIKADSAQFNYSDQNSPKAITQQPNIDILDEQYRSVEKAISNVKNANSDTFLQMKLDAESQIAKLKLLTTEFKNAENAATSLRSKPVESVKIDEGNSLNVFVEKMKQSGNYTEELQAKVAALSDMLSKVGDAQGLTNYLNQLDNLKSKFALINASSTTLDKSTKLSTNLDTELTKLLNYENELKDLGVISGDIKTKFDSLIKSLGEVGTQSGLTTWRSELKGFESDASEAIRQQKLLNNELKILENMDKDMLSIPTSITNIETNLKRLNNPSVELKDTINQLSIDFKALDSISDSGDKVKAYSNLKNEIAQTAKEVNALNRAQTQEVNMSDVKKFDSSIVTWMNENTKAANRFEQEIYEIQIALQSVDSKTQFNSLRKKFQAITKEAQALGITGRTLGEELKNNFGKFTQWFGVSQAVMAGIREIKKFGAELTNVDTILTEISKTSDITTSNLKKLGIEAYDAASKYGATAEGYLLGVQEMSRAGFGEEQAKQLSELSILAQSAGDMTAELANEYLIATNFAYGYEGSVSKLNEVLDGQNQITNRNAVNMSELAAATKIAGSQSAQSGIEIDEMTAALGTMMAVTQRSGDTVARSFKGILMNLQSVSGEIDGEVFDEKSFKKVEGTLNDVGVAMETIVDGSARLRNPMQILKELSEVYNSLPDDSAKKANIIADLGGKVCHVM